MTSERPIKTNFRIEIEGSYIGSVLLDDKHRIVKVDLLPNHPWVVSLRPRNFDVEILSRKSNDEDNWARVQVTFDSDQGELKTETVIIEE